MRKTDDFVREARWHAYGIVVAMFYISQHAEHTPLPLSVDKF
jgi:hypothetical protein